jgi:hypothetical protein
MEESLEETADPVFGKGEAEMLRGDILQRVGFIEDHKVIGKEVSLLLEVIFGVKSPHEGEKEGVVDDHDRSELRLDAGLLKKAFGIRSARAGGTDMGFAADLMPDFGIRGEPEVGEGSVFGLLRPFPDPFQLFGLGFKKEIAGISHCPFESTGTKIVLAAFEKDGGEILVEDLSGEGDILMEKLLLKIDRMGRDDRFLVLTARVEDGGDQIPETLADPGPRFDDEGVLIFEGFGDGSRHLLLGFPELEFFRLGHDSVGGKELFDLQGEGRSELFTGGDHGRSETMEDKDKKGKVSHRDTKARK